MGKEALSVNIISSCVCRDFFELESKKARHNNYKVEFFYQATDVFSLYSQKCPELQSLTEADLVFGSPWQRRIFLADIKKDIFDRIGKDKRDNYLIIEFTDFAKNLYKLKSDNCSYLVQTEPSKNNESVFSSYIEKIISPWHLPKEYINSCLERYIDDILKIYSPEKIILCEVYHTDRYITLDKRIDYFKAPIKAYNSFLSYCYSFVEEELAKRQARIHIVKTLENAIGDEGQKWGKYSLHFTNDLYEYLFSAVDAICTGYDYDEENEILSFLKAEYEKRIKEALDNIEATEALSKSLKDLQKRLSELEKQNDEVQKDLQKRLSELEKQNDKIQKEKNDVVSENNSLKNELINVRASKTYKIGRVATFIPRKLFKRRESK